MRHPRRTDHPPLIERLVEHGWSVMLYDGDCVLCSGAVRFLATRTRLETRFADLPATAYNRAVRSLLRILLPALAVLAPMIASPAAPSAVT